jgi:hypothetical protein
VSPIITQVAPLADLTREAHTAIQQSGLTARREDGLRHAIGQRMSARAPPPSR